jgi:hypothetical protein
MAEMFAIDPKSEKTKLNAQGEGVLEFTVTNRSSDELRARARAIPEAGCEASWLEVDPPAAAFTPGGARVIQVKIKAPKASEGRYVLQLEVATERNPDREKTTGPKVSFSVDGGTVIPWWKRFWWIPVAAVLVLSAVVVGVRVLSKPADLDGRWRIDDHHASASPIQEIRITQEKGAKDFEAELVLKGDDCPCGECPSEEKKGSASRSGGSIEWADESPGEEAKYELGLTRETKDDAEFLMLDWTVTPKQGPINNNKGILFHKLSGAPDPAAVPVARDGTPLHVALLRAEAFQLHTAVVADVLSPGAPTPATPSGTPPLCRPMQIVATHSGKCLDVAGARTENGVPFIQHDCIGPDHSNQIFTLKPFPSGGYQVVAKHSGKCLDVFGVSTVNGAIFHQWDCLGETQRNQVFVLNPVAGGYQFVAQHSNKCLDVAGVSAENGAPMHQWDCLGASQRNQVFETRPLP